MTVSKLDSSQFVDRVPEPAVIRGAVVGVTALISVIIGKNIDISWLEGVLTVYTVLSPGIAAWWIRRSVTPTSVVEKIAAAAESRGRHAKLEEDEAA